MTEPRGNSRAEQFIRSANLFSVKADIWFGRVSALVLGLLGAIGIATAGRWIVDYFAGDRDLWYPFAALLPGLWLFFLGQFVWRRSI